MREQLEKLVVLQHIDLRISAMERAKGEIPQRIATLEEDLMKEETKVAGQRAELEKMQKERRQKEKDLEEEADKIKKTEARVFEIKTNKEYQAVQKEIESAKKLNRQREEEILGYLERLDQSQKSVTSGETELEAKRKDTQQRIADLTAQAASFAAEMAEEVQQRDEKAREIRSPLLSRYRMLLEKRQGIAMAQVANGVCQACHMNLRPQLFIELQKQETMILCPNCNRILFWKNGSEKANET